MRRFIQLLAICTVCAFTINAQEFDDIYNTGNSGKSKSVNVKTNAGTRPATVVRIKNNDKNASVQVVENPNYKEVRDVDEYNRRGAYEPLDTNTDVYADSIQDQSNDFEYTQRIARYHNADVIIQSNDPDLIEIYYDQAPTVNIVMETPSYMNWWTWDYGWHGTLGWGCGLMSPWHYSWSTWAWGHLHHAFYDPWYTWGLGWHDPYYSLYWGGLWGTGMWHHHHYWGDPYHFPPHTPYYGSHISNTGGRNSYRSSGGHDYATRGSNYNRNNSHRSAVRGNARNSYANDRRTTASRASSRPGNANFSNASRHRRADVESRGNSFGDHGSSAGVTNYRPQYNESRSNRSSSSSYRSSSSSRPVQSQSSVRTNDSYSRSSSRSSGYSGGSYSGGGSRSSGSSGGGSRSGGGGGHRR